MTDTTAPVSVNWRERLEQGAFEEALAQLRALELVSQGEPESRAVLERVIEFRQHVRAGKYEEAQKVSREGWMGLGVSTVGLEEALRLISSPTDEELDTAIERAHPLTLADAHNNRGKSLVNSDEAAAERHFHLALEADPRHYRAMTNVGNIALEHGQLDQAIGLYRKAIELAPDYATAHNNLAAALRRQGKLAESVSALKRSQRLALQQLRQKDAAKGPFGERGKAMSGWFENPTVRWVLLGVVVFLIYRLLAR